MSYNDIRFLFIGLWVEADETVAHRGKPQVTLWVACHPKHADIVTLGKGLLMECLRLGVNPSASLTVRTNPDSSLQIFRNRQHRTGEMVFIVISQVFVLIETIEPVFVRADP